MRQCRFDLVAEIATDPGRSFVYEHGWQSWSPAGLYPATAVSPRPPSADRQRMAFRPGKPAPAVGFQGEGLLAVVPPEGPVRVWSSPEPSSEVASIRARAEAGCILVSADGPVVEQAVEGPLVQALSAWAERAAARAGVSLIASIPPGWCSWYCY